VVGHVDRGQHPLHQRADAAGFFTNDVVVRIAAGGEHYHALMGQPGFTLGLQPSSGTTAPGGFINSTISILPVHGFHGQVQLQISGLPSGVTGLVHADDHQPVRPVRPGAADVRVQSTGTFPVLITAIAQDNTIAQPVQTATYQLTIARALVHHRHLPGQGTGHAGGSTTTQVTLDAVGGYTGTAALAVSGLPSGVTGSFSAAQVSSGHPSTADAPDVTGQSTGDVPGDGDRDRPRARGSDGDVPVTIAAPSEGVPGFTLTLGNSEFPAGRTGLDADHDGQPQPRQRVHRHRDARRHRPARRCHRVVQPAAGRPRGQATLTLTIDGPAPGSYEVTITGTAANGTSASTTLELAIGGPAVPDGP
jgi:hypothetical protein